MIKEVVDMLLEGCDSEEERILLALRLERNEAKRVFYREKEEEEKISREILKAELGEF